MWGSNSRPSDYETDALPNCANEASGPTRQHNQHTSFQVLACRCRSNKSGPPLENGSGWPSGLRRCVQVAVSSGGVGSNPTSDKPILWLRTAAAVFSPLARCPLQGNLFANVFFFVNIKGSRKLAFPLTENLILNVSMTLTLRKPDKDTDTCCMNMRGMLLLHSFSVSPAWTLNFDCTVYQRMA